MMKIIMLILNIKVNIKIIIIITKNLANIINQNLMKNQMFPLPLNHNLNRNKNLVQDQILNHLTKKNKLKAKTIQKNKILILIIIIIKIKNF